jgi:protein-L-isoaspartate(D-aspartate) O-methyltransferase
MLEDTYKLKGLREKLVKTLQQKGIRDTQVLEAIRTVPRHFFVDDLLAEESYKDQALPIGSAQTISQPLTVARQTELLQVKSGMKVLEIGTGSGYQCAILCALGAKVFTVERHIPLYQKAQVTLTRLGYKPRMKGGDGSLGWETWAPYERIIITAGGPNIPEAYLQQLAPGGIIVMPVGTKEKQILEVLTLTLEGKWITENAGPVKFVPLIGEQGW